uniref:HMA domain-containing protein n=1 Tax=Triticum urartu TaxID=4572 RepID=A0A8R7R140_TRIUA
MPTIIIKVDLDCGRCHAKIRKVLERIREKGEFIIDDIKYDEKKNHVIVSGPFDADKLGDKLCCKACNIIKEIETVEPPKKQDPKPPPATDKVKPLPVPGGAVRLLLPPGTRRLPVLAEPSAAVVSVRRLHDGLRGGPVRRLHRHVTPRQRYHRY